MEKNNNEREGFSYTYSAKEQEELKKIREKYTPTTEKETKMERLRRLDSRVTQKAQIVSIILGIIGVLILGFGMSIFMTELGELVGADSELSMAIGIAVGIVGCILVILAYPTYNFVIRRERKKIAPEIIRLTDELMK